VGGEAGPDDDTIRERVAAGDAVGEELRRHTAPSRQGLITGRDRLSRDMAESPTVSLVIRVPTNSLPMSTAGGRVAPARTDQHPAGW
jgi:hypothetical protein